LFNARLFNAWLFNARLFNARLFNARFHLQQKSKKLPPTEVLAEKLENVVIASARVLPSLGRLEEVEILRLIHACVLYLELFAV
jgi:hypothetical protein